MRIFQKPNLNNGKWRCLICGKNTEKPVTLVPDMDKREGNNVRAEQVHVDCIDLWIYRAGKSCVLAHVVTDDEGPD